MTVGEGEARSDKVLVGMVGDVTERVLPSRIHGVAPDVAERCREADIADGKASDGDFRLVVSTVQLPLGRLTIVLKMIW